METIGAGTEQPPLLAAVLQVRSALAEVADTPTWSLDAVATTRLVEQCAAATAQLAELEARVVHHAETLDLAGAAGMRGAAQWLARRTTVNESTAHSKVRLARATAAHEPTRAALARGEVHAEQAVVITRSVDLLDDDETVVSPQDKERAEQHLLGEAVDQDARALTILGGRLFEVLDPAGADAHEARQLEAQEKKARDKTVLSMRDDGAGLTRGSFAIPTLHASMFKKALIALAAPKAKRARDGAGSYDVQTPSDSRLGEAFLTYVERYPTDKLPMIGGLAANVVVIGAFDVLRGRVKAAHLDTGTKISHTGFIRLACEAGLVPAWMDTTTGKTLSLGRKQRFHQPHQRLAKLLETDTCEDAHCQTPAWLCHLHHNIPWSKGGATDIDTAVVLCPFHHHRAHASGTTHPIRT